MDASQMTAKLDYVGIERLENYVGKKVSYRCFRLCCGYQSKSQCIERPQQSTPLPTSHVLHEPKENVGMQRLENCSEHCSCQTSSKAGSGLWH